MFATVAIAAPTAPQSAIKTSPESSLVAVVMTWMRSTRPCSPRADSTRQKTSVSEYSVRLRARTWSGSTE